MGSLSTEWLLNYTEVVCAVRLRSALKTLDRGLGLVALQKGPIVVHLQCLNAGTSNSQLFEPKHNHEINVGSLVKCRNIIALRVH